MSGKIDLLNLSLKELGELLANLGYNEGFRAKQIISWFYKGIDSIDDMTNISKELKAALEQVSYIGTVNIYKKQISKDGTIKYIFSLPDGNIIESVLMKYRHGFTVCVSSQVGCKMGCKFCASAKSGFIRNLTTAEMLSQVLYIRKDIKAYKTNNDAKAYPKTIVKANADKANTDSNIHIRNIVIMGIGEPLDNYNNVLKFVRQLNMPEGLNISYRKITISTCGLVPEMLKLSNENIPINLSISLHASDDKKRQAIMPINKSYSIDKIIEACKIYSEKTRRRITFEYAMIKDYNDFEKDAFDLAEKLRGILCYVNIIPINPIDGSEFRPSSREKTNRFKRALENKGINVTVRRELGQDIDAACGQLRRRLLKK